jgi:hypothetical protein
MQLAQVGAVTVQLSGNFRLTDSLGLSPGLEGGVESLALKGPTRIVPDTRTDGSNLTHLPVT